MSPQQNKSQQFREDNLGGLNVDATITRMRYFGEDDNSYGDCIKLVREVEL